MEKAMYYYRQGHNCSQCILRSAEHKYKINTPDECYEMCSAVSNGFGIGGICSVLTAGIMVFGLLYDDPTAKRLRIKLLSMCQEKYGSIDCGTLKASGNGCEKIVEEIEGMIDLIIQEEDL